MTVEWFVIALILFMVIAALIAVQARDLLSSVIALGAAGFALSIIDLMLGAPDLAITQVVVEVIVLVMLVRVVLTREDTASAQPRDLLRTGIVLVAGGIVLAAAFFAVGGRGAAGMPPFGEPLMAKPKPNMPKPVGGEYLALSAEETGAANTVTAVLLDYRAYDTLGEATVIFVSVLGVYVILRHVGRRKKEAAL